MRLVRCLIAVLASGILISGCIEESTVPVVFDQELISVTFENRLFTPLVIIRDLQIIDTLPALERRTYPLNRKGIIQHAWKIVPAYGATGRIAGIEPLVELGIQYDIEAEYIITNNSIPGRTIFTPRIANFSLFDLQVYANYNEDDEFWSDYVVPRSGITSDIHAPYYYWHSRSNIYLVRLGGVGGYFYSRADTGEFALRMDNTFGNRDAGATTPILVR